METRPGTPFPLEINPRLPNELARLEELANNLWFSWNRAARGLFARLDPELWDALEHSPKALLKEVDQRRLEEAAHDPVFLHDYFRTLAAYDSYHGKVRNRGGIPRMREGELVAYFCAEFGFHESLPIYSGGLGILAGDHCKTASDMAIPFVAVGLLYRQGYFHQKIDAEGTQNAHYYDSDFAHLPITPVETAPGQPLEVKVEFGEHDVYCKVWKAKVGRIDLYLLDTDHEKNRPEDRATAHRLYGGDRNTRIQQEIVLGMGGFRALQAMGIKPTAFHMNEILDEADLPRKYTAASTCFRREAGTYGKDTAGIYRIHQFDKVEQVVICRNDEAESRRWHVEMLGYAEEVLKRLQLPYRVIQCCTGDLGPKNASMIDIETWMPSREQPGNPDSGYGETHSASRLYDFQARRMNLRYREKDGKTIKFCHTLNNTVVASPRILIPILENYQNADGTVTIPEALRPYMHGKDRIG